MIVTRGHRDDMRALRLALDTPARYIAMIGSRRKVISVMKELEKENISRESFARIAREAPDLLAHVHREIVRLQAERLRSANAETLALHV